MKKKLTAALSALLACACLCMPFASASGAEQPEGKFSVIPEEQAPDGEEIAALLEKEPIIFVEAESGAVFGADGERQINFADNAPNQNVAELAYEYYFRYNDGIQRGEIYVTPNDTEESVADLLSSLYGRAESGHLTGAYLSSFAFGSKYIPLQKYATARTVNAMFNGERLGTMVDCEQAYILNNPGDDTLHLVIAHETHLFPTHAENRNYKGVGVRMQLEKVDGFFSSPNYGPRGRGDYGTIFSDVTFGLTGELSSESDFGCFYRTGVESPKIISGGNIGEEIYDLRFEYVDPGSWYGPLCDYNSYPTSQSSYVAMRAAKDGSAIQYTSRVTGRFQKYENWPFPWVDEYFTIPMDTVYRIDDLLQVIEDANA